MLDVINKAEKGYYNASDLNRVRKAAEYIQSLLYKSGVTVVLSNKKTWTEQDIPTALELDNYIQDVSKIRSAISVLPSTPYPPDSAEYLTWSSANDIEKILFDIDTILNFFQKVFLRSGTSWAISNGPNYNFLDYSVSSLLDVDSVNLVSSDDFYLTADYSYQYKPPVITWRTLITKDKMYLKSSDEFVLEAKTIG